MSMIFYLIIPGIEKEAIAFPYFNWTTWTDNVSCSLVHHFYRVVFGALHSVEHPPIPSHKKLLIFRIMLITNNYKPSHVEPSRLAIDTTIFFSTFDIIRKVVWVMSLAKDSTLTTVPILPQAPGPTIVDFKLRYYRFSYMLLCLNELKHLNQLKLVLFFCRKIFWFLSVSLNLGDYLKCFN